MLEIAFGKTSSFYQSLMNDGIVTYLNANHRSYNGAKLLNLRCILRTGTLSSGLRLCTRFRTRRNYRRFCNDKNSYLGVYLKNAAKSVIKLVHRITLIRNF